MNIGEWIEREKLNTPELSDFLTKIKPYLLPSGFYAIEFERKVVSGVKKAEKEIEDSLKHEPNVES